MSVKLTSRLIEQFAAQAPFAIWMTDAHGVAVFANKKLHETLDLSDHPSWALGLNLFRDRSMERLGIAAILRRAQGGEIVEANVTLPGPPARVLNVNCYALRSQRLEIEYFVFLIHDVSDTHIQREQLRQYLHDLRIFNTSRRARLERLTELRQEAARLEKEIAAHGGVPVGHA